MFRDLISKTIFQNTVGDYLFSLVILGFLLVFVYVLKRILIKRLEKWASATKTTIDDFMILQIKKTLIPLLVLGSFILSLKNLVMNPMMTKTVYILGVAVTVVLCLKFLMQTIDYLIDIYFNKKNVNEMRRRSLKWLVVMVKTIIVAIMLVVLLDNMGIKISALVAGLGIGGIAIAFASQAILADLFSFFVILFDRPFEIGDFIVVDDLSGTVEYIGIKTTRIRSISGEELVFSNTTLTNARVRNYKRMARRRIIFKINVTYGNSMKNIQDIPEILKQIVSSEQEVSFDRAHFASYGDFALIYEVVYNILSSDYNKYMDIQQRINFKIKEEFDKRKIEFAYPTQTVFINK